MRCSEPGGGVAVAIVASRAPLLIWVVRSLNWVVKALRVNHFESLHPCNLRSLLNSAIANARAG
jgi:hypothetical protein